MTAWSFGRYSLRLSESDFWDLTLVQFNALAGRYKEEQEWLNLRAGLVKKEETPTNLTPDQMVAQAIAFAAQIKG